MYNAVKTAVLLGLLSAIILWMGSVLGGTQGLTIALIFAGIMNFGAYWFSDRVVLAAYGARPLSEAEAPALYRIVRELSLAAGLPMPRIYLVPSDSPNAFATGRSPDHAAVAVTAGILRLLDEEELKGVLAHELSHVRNRDTLIGTVAATLAAVVMYVASMARWAAVFGGFDRDDREGGGGLLGFLVLVIVAPIAAMLIQMAISRTREFQADASAARLAGTPLGLAAALEKLAYASGRLPMGASPQTAHLFIVNPLRGGGISRWFSTHPPVEERIRRLRARAY